MRRRVARWVLLDDSRDPAAQEVLWRRKWSRAHLGKPSYESRGVSASEYHRYWDEYVAKRWQAHGGAANLERCRLAGEINHPPLILDALAPAHATAKAVADWLVSESRVIH